MAHVGRPFTDYKPPAAAPVWAAIEGLGRYHVLLAALELGVFEALDEASTAAGMRAEALAERLGLPTLHMESLPDSVIALGLLDRVVDDFRLNDAARRYLLVDGAASMAGLIPVAPGPHENWTRLADTVRSGRPATPIDDDPAAFYVPLVEGTFTTVWRCATRADLQLRYSALAAGRWVRGGPSDRAHRLPIRLRGLQAPRLSLDGHGRQEANMSERERIDTLIKGWYVVTMNPTRDIIRHGAVAVRGNEIVAVGKASDLEAAHEPAETVGGDRFVVTPGLVNTHIHVTGEPLTRGYVPDDTPFEENVFMWLCPLYSVYTPEEERLSAQLAAVEMLKSGTTTFLEAGTIRFTDEVMDGLVEAGIRGRHPAPHRQMGVGPAARARRLPPEHRRRHRQHQRDHRAPPRHRGRAPGGVVDGGGPHHLLGSALTGRPRGGRPSRSGPQLPHEPGQPRSRGVHRRVRAALHDPSGRAGGARHRHRDDALRAGGRQRARCDGRSRLLGGALPHHRAQGQLRRHPGRQDPGDGDAGHQREHRHRRQQRLQLRRHAPGHVSGGRAVQGRSHGPPDVPGREGLRDGHPRRSPHHAHVRRGRLAGATQEGRCGAVRHRPPRVAAEVVLQHAIGDARYVPSPDARQLAHQVGVCRAEVGVGGIGLEAPQGSAIDEGRQFSADQGSIGGSPAYQEAAVVRL